MTHALSSIISCGYDTFLSVYKQPVYIQVKSINFKSPQSGSQDKNAFNAGTSGYKDLWLRLRVH